MELPTFQHFGQKPWRSHCHGSSHMWDKSSQDDALDYRALKAGRTGAKLAWMMYACGQWAEKQRFGFSSVAGACSFKRTHEMKSCRPSAKVLGFDQTSSRSWLSWQVQQWDEWRKGAGMVKERKQDAVLFLFLDPESPKDVYKQRTKWE